MGVIKIARYKNFVPVADVQKILARVAVVCGDETPLTALSDLIESNLNYDLLFKMTFDIIFSLLYFIPLIFFSRKLRVCLEDTLLCSICTSKSAQSQKPGGDTDICLEAPIHPFI